MEYSQSILMGFQIALQPIHLLFCFIGVLIGTLVGVEQEGGSGGKESAENTVRNLAGFRVRIDKPTGSKVDRADPFSVQVNAGNVYVVRAPWNQIWINEMMYWPDARFKDQGDSAAGAFNMLRKRGRRVGAFRRTKRATVAAG